MLQELENRKVDLMKQLMNPAVSSDGEKVKQISIELGRLEKELAAARASGSGNIDDASKIILEVRAGTGGDEAALFARDLAQNYTRYAESQGWEVRTIASHATDIGGYREIVLEITGKGSYKKLKHESGTHRVQRIPATEKGGRIHTSAATVAVLPLTQASNREIEISESDLRIDTYRASGKGGQHVNKTDSAVRLTHIPTGIVVSCQDERSQHKNKEKALRILKARLYYLERQQNDSSTDQARREQVGTGDRSGKIRTYNYPQNRITDHRFNKSWGNLDAIMGGSLNQIIEYIMSATMKEDQQ